MVRSLLMAFLWFWGPSAVLNVVIYVCDKVLPELRQKREEKAFAEDVARMLLSRP